MKIQLLTDNKNELSLFENPASGLTQIAPGEVPREDTDLLIVNINARRGERSKRRGMFFLHQLRRDHFIPTPVIAYSFEARQVLEADFPILKTKGISFLRLPFAPGELAALLEKLPERLIESELIDIVCKTCDLKEEWSKISHIIGGYLSDYTRHKDRITDLVNEWGRSIDRFAGEQMQYLDAVRELHRLPDGSLDLNELKSAVQTLDEHLQDRRPSPGNELVTRRIYPKYPPKGFSKVLIADDEPLDSLKFDLQNEYSYRVVGQAKGINEAKRQLQEKKPTVILSDFYFKESEHDKTTDRKFGVKFMIFARTFNFGSDEAHKNPIVAVISKTSLDPADIPFGVLDCSGTRNATNPEFIHNAIWIEAERRGVTETEDDGEKWTGEYYCRQRLEPYQSDLPKLVRQWDSFSQTVTETLLMIRSIRDPNDPAEKAIIDRIIHALEPHQNVKDFSFEQVSDIFFEVEAAHKAAKTPPNSEIKFLIRNILHGKIEQFAVVVNHLDFTLKVFEEISSDLVALAPYNKIGKRLKKNLDDFSKKKPVLSFLETLKSVMELALGQLPEIPRPVVDHGPAPANPKKVEILVVEDNKVWAETVISAVEKAALKLGGTFKISFRHFDNAESALKAVPQIKKTPSNATPEEEKKTIAIVDICIPENNKPNQIPEKNNGIQVIKNLTDYRTNVPVIVFSTKSSLEDIRDIGKLGIPDENFVSKESFDAEASIIEALVNLLEKKQKYIIRRVEREKKDSVYYAFSINGISVDFSNELSTTFQALFELRSEGDFENKTEFAAEEIYARKLENSGKREIVSTKQEKRYIQSHINEIRGLIHDAFRQNNRYIDVRDLIKTSLRDDDESYYELNGQLPSLEEEENMDDDHVMFKNRQYKVLVIEKNDDHRDKIVTVLKGPLHVIEVLNSSDRDFTKKVIDFCPEVVVVNLEQFDCWKNVKLLLPNDRRVVMVTTTDAEPNKKRLLGIALKSGVTNKCVVSTNRETWINSFLTKVADAKIEMFSRGEIGRSNVEANEPIVEVLAESDLAKGILRLRVNGEPFTMNKSNISKIIGHLLLNPKTLIPLETIKEDAIGSREPVTIDDQKGWTKKIRNKVQEEWLRTDDRRAVKEILHSSEKGMKLNVQIIYPQPGG